MRGVTGGLRLNSPEREISTHTPHARRDLLAYLKKIEIKISTHTPHARRDHHNGFFVVAV